MIDSLITKKELIFLKCVLTCLERARPAVSDYLVLLVYQDVESLRETVISLPGKYKTADKIGQQR